MEWNILGNEWAVEMLQTHIRNDQVRHAYLFCGPRGVGRRSLALRFAQALNCPQPPRPGEPCGTCRTCTLTERMQHPDLSVLVAETEGGSIKIDPVRNLQHTLSLSPFEARYRVALLLRFHEATPNAQNALLKTLEEPAERVILLLTADSPESVLPTIASRCEMLRLHRLPLEKLSAALETRWGIPAGEADLLAHVSGGRPGVALRLHHNPDEMEQRHAWLDDLSRMLGSTRRERFTYAAQLTKDRDREKLLGVFQVWLSYWRDVMLVASGSSAPLTNQDRAEEVHRLGKTLDLPSATTRTQHMEQAIGNLGKNANMQLLTEVLLLDWPKI